MNVLLLGWYYASNMGDAVISDCVAAQIRAAFPDANIRIRDLAGRTGFPERNAGELDRAMYRQRKRVMRVIATKLGWDKQYIYGKRCIEHDAGRIEGIADGDWDLAVFAGGQIFMDDLILYARNAVERLNQRGIPVIMNACGTGPSYSGKLQRMLAETLCMPNVKAVSCRDNTGLVNRWCGQEIVVSTSDPALRAGEVYGVEKNRNTDTVGLGIMFPRSLNSKQVISFWKKVIRALDDRGISWMAFTNGNEADMEFARLILEDRTEQLCPAPENPEELVRTISNFGGLISFRLHSHIIAASLDIPTVAVVWDDKLLRFFEKLGCPERCVRVSEDPGRVLDALELAQKQGWNRALIEEQAADAQRLLTQAIQAEVGEG